MGKIRYVNGTIIVDTTEFKYHVEDGCLWDIPEGTETIPPNKTIDGTPFYVIDDHNTISIFDSIRASGGFTALDSGSYYFNSTYKEIYESYLCNKREIEDFLNKNASDSFAYKLLFMNIMTLLDSFVCEIFISRLTSDEAMFYEILDKSCKKDRYKEIVEEYGPNNERCLVYYKMDESYINWKKINSIFKNYFNSYNIISAESPIVELIKLRHNVVHNNARERNGKIHCFTKNEVQNALKDVDNLVETIMTVVRSYSQDER